MTGKETEATAPAINIANDPKAGDAEFPVVRSSQFFQVTPTAFSVWADLSSPPTFDIVLHKPFYREISHVVASNPTGGTNLLKKNVMIEISELGVVTCGLTAAIGLYNQLKGFLAQLPDDVRERYSLEPDAGMGGEDA
jgi:hypothetical protein